LLSASYSINKTKTFDTIKRDDADIVTVSPQVYFAVNPYTSLNRGVKYSYFGKTTVDGKTVANSGSNLSFVTGVSYEIASDMFVSANAEYLNEDLLFGNAKIKIAKFKEMFYQREDLQYLGKVLIVFPPKEGVVPNRIFTKVPQGSSLIEDAIRSRMIKH